MAFIDSFDCQNKFISMVVFGKERLLSFSIAVNNVKNILDFLSGESFMNYYTSSVIIIAELSNEHSRTAFRSSRADHFSKIVVLNILRKSLENTYKGVHF